MPSPLPPDPQMPTLTHLRHDMNRLQRSVDGLHTDLTALRHELTALLHAHDARLRATEIGQADLRSTLTAVQADVVTLEGSTRWWNVGNSIAAAIAALLGWRSL